MGASAQWFQLAYNQVTQIMTRWLNVIDSSGTGVITCAQPSTYDCALYGANTFITSLYLTALAAAEKMAILQGDTTNAILYADRYALGTANLDTLCFTNGQWYTQVVDPANPYNIVGDSTFMDSLGGQWWAWLLGLGPILPSAHVSSTISSIMTANWVESFNPAAQSPRQFFDERDSGMFIARWGADSPPANALLYTSEAAWSGLVYPYAGLCFLYGQQDNGMQILTATRNSYDGTRRTPYNEIECGDHYSRPMAGFALFEIASGQVSCITLDDYNDSMTFTSFGMQPAACCRLRHASPRLHSRAFSSQARDGVCVTT